MKMISLAGLAACLALLPVSSVLAAPTYLLCRFADPPNEAQIFNFMLEPPSETLGIHVPETGSQRKVKGELNAGKLSANEGFVAWEVDPAALIVIRDKRMVARKDRGVCTVISAAQSGFEP